MNKFTSSYGYMDSLYIWVCLEKVDFRVPNSQTHPESVLLVNYGELYL